MSKLPENIQAEDILNQTSDGIYVTDLHCRIQFWNSTAERITGWSEKDVLGKLCADGILCHVNRDGVQLCQQGRCPLHRSMQENKASLAPRVLFANTKSGERIPVSVSVSPLRDKDGRVIGGIEVFRDESEHMLDLERARLVQANALPRRLPQGKIVSAALYRPHGAVGGDYYQVQVLPDGSQAFMLADVVGHGVSAAMYTMTLNALWHQHAALMHEPAKFFTILNEKISKLIIGDSYLTAFMGVVEPESGALAYAVAGHPPPLVCDAQGKVEELHVLDMPLGMLPGTIYQQEETRLDPDSLLLIYSDAALECQSPAGDVFGEKRLKLALQKADPGQLETFLTELEKALLSHVESAALPDDLTLLCLARLSRGS